MIFGTDLSSITESIYLNIPFTDSIRKGDIYVNPERITYLVGKTIIINKFNYSSSYIPILLKNNNKIISRIFIDNPNIIFDPYLPRINFRILWNGQIAETLGEDYMDSGNQNIFYSQDSETLYFPKVKNYRDKPGIKGEYNYLGYLLYQTGLNLYPDFKDLDVIKCGKGYY